MNKEDYDKYYQQGGSYVIPVEIFNELFEDYECFKNDCKKRKEVIGKAIEIAYEYAQIDGAHHKMWAIDQMIRKLLGNEYDNFIKDYEEDGKYEWDAGIAP